MKKSCSILESKNNITSIAIGGFDGMHLGHQKLFEKLDKKTGAILVIESGFSNITPSTYRQEYTNLPVFYYQLKDIKNIEGDEFIKLLQKDFPKLNKIVVGFDFCFGKDRKYCTKNLKELFHGDVIVIDEVCTSNIGVHSRNIREYILNGQIDKANEFLAKPYKIVGEHIKGQGLGSKSFVPTINIQTKDFLLPKDGVYATKTLIENHEYNSVSFIGNRVTTDGSFAIETHLFDKLIEKKYGFIEIVFLKKIRENQKFDNFEALKEQIFIDIKNAKDFLSK